MHFQLKSIGCLSYPITHHAKRTAHLSCGSPFPNLLRIYFVLKYASIPFAAAFPAPIARMTVAVSCHGISTGKHTTLGCSTVFFLCHDTLSAVRLKSLCRGRNQRVRRSSERHDDRVRLNLILRPRNLHPDSLLPEASGSPSSILMTLAPFTQPFSSTKSSVGFCNRSKIMPSSFA